MKRKLQCLLAVLLSLLLGMTAPAGAEEAFDAGSIREAVEESEPEALPAAPAEEATPESEAPQEPGENPAENLTEPEALPVPEVWEETSSGEYSGATPQELAAIGIDPVYADSDFVINKKGVLKKYKGHDPVVVIPDGVKKIGNAAFYERIDSAWDALNTVVVPEGVTHIANYAFKECFTLEEIRLPGTLKSIGKCAFESCYSLHSFVIPAGVSEISGPDYYGGLPFPETTTLIVTEGSYAEEYCREHALKYLYATEAENTQFLIQDGVLTAYLGHDANVTVPSGVTAIGDHSFCGNDKLRSVTIPQGVTSIGDQAFKYCKNLTKIELPEGLQSIGEEAFCFCHRLREILLADGLQSIDDAAFLQCYHLREINLPKSLKSIGRTAFSDCSQLAEVDLPEGLQSIGWSAFADCPSLKYLMIPQSVTDFGMTEFEDWEEVPDFYDSEVTFIVTAGSEAEKYCQKYHPNYIVGPIVKDQDFVFGDAGVLLAYVGDEVDVHIPLGVTSIGANAFSYNATLRSVTIPQGVTSIGRQAFEDCKNLAKVELSEGLLSIGYDAFSGCEALRRMEIPASVTELEYDDEWDGNGPFDWNYGFTAIVTPGSPAAWQCSSIPSMYKTDPLEMDTDVLLQVGETKKLRVTSPQDAVFTYESSNKKVAAVSASGKITAKKAGTAVIVVTDVNSESQAACLARVDYPFNKLEIEAPLTATPGRPLQLRYTIKPQNHKLNEVTWSSSDESIAAVDEDGWLTALQAGEVTVTATSVAVNAKGEHLSDSVSIQIVASDQPSALVLSRSGPVALKRGKKLRLLHTVVPGWVDQTVTWKSSNSKVAKVVNGVVTARNRGTATITATTTNGITAKVKINVS